MKHPSPNTVALRITSATTTQAKRPFGCCGLWFTREPTIVEVEDLGVATTLLNERALVVEELDEAALVLHLAPMPADLAEIKSLAIEEPVESSPPVIEEPEEEISSPTLEEWMAAGYPADRYPPEGFDEVPSPGLTAYREQGSLAIAEVIEEPEDPTPEPDPPKPKPAKKPARRGRAKAKKTKRRGA